MTTNSLLPEIILVSTDFITEIGYKTLQRKSKIIQMTTIKFDYIKQMK